MNDAPNSPVFYAPSDDPGMNAAYAEARRTFKYFWRELSWEYRRIIPALDLAVVKAAFGDPGGHSDDIEHMWLGEVDFDGDVIRAKLLNAPNHLRSVKAGDSIELSLGELEDWMYVREGRVYGGFTIQTMRLAMPDSERRSHDAAWGFEFGDPASVRLVPDWNAKKPGLFARLLGKVPPEVLADADAEHPMSESMATKLAEDIAANPEGFLRDTSLEGFSLLHGLSLGGSAACVKVLLENGVPLHAKTPSGRTALDLARQMDWPRVVSLLESATTST